MPATTHKYVTTESCDAKHGGSKRVTGVLLGLLGLICGGVMWAVGIGYGADSKATEALHQIDTQVQIAAEQDKAISEKLDRIQAGQDRLTSRLDQFIKDSK